MKILIADDDPTIRLLVQGALRAMSHEVVACESGKVAWQKLKEGHYPMIVTDWMMPDFDGLQLTQLVRRTPSDSYTYIIMLTSKTSREDYFKAIDGGVDAFLPKPVDRAMLEAQVTIGIRILGREAHASQLESIMTVCMECKRVRDKGEWHNLEAFVSRTYKVRPSHGYCPTCFDTKIIPEMRAFGIATDGMKPL
jgi:phosphoserine phosphatase RsbU/P